MSEFGKAAAAVLSERDYELHEREAIQEEGREPDAIDPQIGAGSADATELQSFIEFAPTFLSSEDPPAPYLIEDLLPEQVLQLDHGEPRTRKTWAALEMAIALSTGTPAFGLERFAVSQAVPVLYSSQEDAARLVRIRAKALLRGRGTETFPETLAFSVHKGINLDSMAWRERLLTDVNRYGLRLVVLDPIRRYSPNTDKGPAEVREITGFLRTLTIETGASVAIIHHDVKPPANGQDARRRSQRASGGDWFAASECPISFEQAGDKTTLVTPEDFKVSSDPLPFTFTIETDDDRSPTVARMIGETTSSGEATTLAVDEGVMSYLSEHQGASGRAITQALRKDSDTVRDSLERLLEADKVDCVDLGRGRGKKWTVR